MGLIVRLGRRRTGKTVGALWSAADLAPAIAWGRIAPRIEIGDEWCDWPSYRNFAAWRTAAPPLAALTVSPADFASAAWALTNDERCVGAVVLDELHTFVSDPEASSIADRVTREHRHTSATWFFATHTVAGLPRNMRNLIESNADALHVHRTTAPLDRGYVQRTYGEYDRTGRWPAWAAGELAGVIADPRMCHGHVALDLDLATATFHTCDC